MKSKKSSLVEVFLIYLVVAVVGFFVAECTKGSLIWKMLASDVFMTCLIFGVSVWKKNSSAYDAYWSVFPFFLWLWLFYATIDTEWHWQHFAAGSVVMFWSVRLTWNWARGWSGWQHEDWRYVNYRERHRALFPFTNFFGIHLLPSLIVFLACLGLFSVATATSFKTSLLILGVAVAFFGTILELIADNQLHDFKLKAGFKKEAVLNRGLWGFMRYPNYFGEVLFWLGLALCGLASGGEFWMISGLIVIVLLFVFISIPLKDTRMSLRKSTSSGHPEAAPDSSSTRRKDRFREFKKLLICFLMVFFLAGFAALGSSSAGDFYSVLEKPNWAPASWVFGPVWAFLYILIAVSFYFLWRNASYSLGSMSIQLFLLQLVLNSLWPWLFFYGHYGAAAFFDIALLIGVLLGGVTHFWWRQHFLGSLLLLPYVGWVIFAAFLNFSVWRLNPEML